jgi:hypothetical protein
MDATGRTVRSKPAPIRCGEPVAADILKVPNTVLFLLQGVAQPEFDPTDHPQRTGKAIELAKLQGEGIDEEAYDRVRKPLVMKLFDIDKVGEESTNRNARASASSSATSCSSSSSCTACR